MASDDGGKRFYFEGFSAPNYTQVPDAVFDVLLPELSESELKVLLYVIRRTFGFKRDADTISLKQLTDGIRTRDGRQLDRGAGISKTSAVRGVNGLVEKGVIVAVRNRSQEKGDQPTTYQLRVVDPVSRFVTPPSPNLEHPRVPDLDPQETVEQNDSNLRRVSRSISDQYDEARLDVLPFAEQLAREFNDRAPLPSTVTRLVNLYRASGLDLDDFADRIDAARGITKERTGSIRGRSEGLGPKPKMGYFFAVLEDLTSRESA